MAAQLDEAHVATQFLNEYRESGEFALLEAAIEHLIPPLEGFQLEPGDPGTFGGLCFVLAQCLRLRFDRGKDPAEIANAINYAELALENFPELSDHDACLLRAERKALLWQCLRSQDDSLSCKDPEASQKAFRLAEEIEQDLEHHRVEGQPRIESTRRRGLSYQLQWEKNDELDHLATSLQLGQQVLALVENSPPEARSDALSDMAFRWQRAFLCFAESRQAGTEGLLLEWEYAGLLAPVMLKDSFELDVHRPLKRIENVMEFCSNIGLLPRQDRGAMLCAVSDLLDECILLLDDAMQTSLEFDLRDHASSSYGLSRLAAAAALEKGASVYRALCLLEKGRGLSKSALHGNTYTKELQQRTDIPAELRAQYLEARRELRDAISAEKPFRHRQTLLRSLRAAEAAVHSAIGTDRFTDGLSQQSILELASTYHVVVINMTSARSDAIIITDDGFQTVPLPDVSEREWIDPSFEIQHRLAQDSEELYHEAHELILSFLRRIWTSVVKPILDKLQIRRQTGPLPTWPHICWIPTGVLSLYPIHGAGLGLHKKSNTFNYVVSFYAPSVRSLVNRRRAISQHHISGVVSQAPPSAVVLAMVETPGMPPEDIWENPEDAPERLNWPVLRYSCEEVELVHRVFPLADIKDITELNPTTKEAITALEAGAPIIHLSCHGYVNYMYPTKSMILFCDWEDDPLTVKVIDALKIKSELVVLSACFTANSGVDDLQDESIQLTSSFFEAGFQRVVGSLWGVAQRQTRDFVDEFYKYLGGHHEGSITTRCVAEACHVAALEVGRRSVSDAEVRGEPLHWAPFICVAV